MLMNGQITEFIKHHYRHFNAAALIDAAEAYKRHLDKGGKMMITLAGAMSTAELGLSLAEMIRQDKVQIISCTGANLEEDLFNLVAHDFYERVPHYRDLTPQDEQELLDRHMLREFNQTIHEEMDYAAEGRNAETFRENFRNWNNIHVPKIYWNATTSKVLTMEFIHGTKVTDLEEQHRRNISPAKVNRLLIKTYLKQLLEDGFFHADPHPGNLLVMADGRLAFFDFGMVGRITPELQTKMIDAFFHAEDAKGVGIYPRSLRGARMDAAICRACG